MTLDKSWRPWEGELTPEKALLLFHDIDKKRDELDIAGLIVKVKELELRLDYEVANMREEQDRKINYLLETVMMPAMMPARESDHSRWSRFKRWLR